MQQEFELKLVHFIQIHKSSVYKSLYITTELEVNQRTPITELRRSSRVRKPVHKFSPSLNYILLTDRGEPECYEEAMEVDASTKWELAMKDEID